MLKIFIFILCKCKVIFPYHTVIQSFNNLNVSNKRNRYPNLGWIEVQKKLLIDYDLFSHSTSTYLSYLRDSKLQINKDLYDIDNFFILVLLLLFFVKIDKFLRYIPITKSNIWTILKVFSLYKDNNTIAIYLPYDDNQSYNIRKENLNKRNNTIFLSFTEDNGFKWQINLLYPKQFTKVNLLFCYKDTEET